MCDDDDDNVESQLHQYTHGITSDPITHFGIVFAALIHDVDHRGVSNGQLCKEEPEMASMYKEKSVAEQNSLDLAWSLLMSDQFASLRGFCFESEKQLLRFRQVVVNSVVSSVVFVG